MSHVVEGSDGVPVNVPSGWWYEEGADGRVVAIPPGGHHEEGSDGRVVAIPKGWWYEAGPDGRIVAIPPGGTYEAGSGGRGVARSKEDSACFPGDAKIRTPKGLETLDSLRTGDLVVSWEKNTGKLVNHRVKKVVPYGVSPVIQVDLSDGRTVRVTGHHTIRTSKGWRKVSSLKAGDQIPSVKDGLYEVRVLGIRHPGESVLVYNLYCEGAYNFVADGMIAHSFTALRTPRVAMNKVLDGLGALRVPQRHRILNAAAKTLLTAVRMVGARDALAEPQRQTTG